jgi:hypothetical protein
VNETVCVENVSIGSLCYISSRTGRRDIDGIEEGFRRLIEPYRALNDFGVGRDLPCFDSDPAAGDGARRDRGFGDLHLQLQLMSAHAERVLVIGRSAVLTRQRTGGGLVLAVCTHTRANTHETTTAQHRQAGTQTASGSVSDRQCTDSNRAVSARGRKAVRMERRPTEQADGLRACAMVRGQLWLRCGCALRHHGVAVCRACIGCCCCCCCCERTGDGLEGADDIGEAFLVFGARTARTHWLKRKGKEGKETCQTDRGGRKERARGEQSHASVRYSREQSRGAGTRAVSKKKELPRRQSIRFIGSTHSPNGRSGARARSTPNKYKKTNTKSKYKTQKNGKLTAIQKA